MSGATAIKLAEFALILGAVFGFGFWQLRSLKKLRERRDRDEG